MQEHGPPPELDPKPSDGKTDRPQKPLSDLSEDQRAYQIAYHKATAKAIEGMTGDVTTIDLARELGHCEGRADYLRRLLNEKGES